MLTCTNWGADRHTMVMLYRSLIRSRLDYGCVVYSSASERVLQMLDTVHHAGLRIATGAFRSSPALSLCAEAGEAPLKYRRAHISLSYLVRILAQLNHPLYHNLENIQPQNIPLNRHVKMSFKKRIRKLIYEFNINITKVKSVNRSYKPPWIYKLPVFLMQLTKFIKKDTSPIIFHNEFNKIKSEHSNSTVLFTDGSKCNDGVGSCFIHEQCEFLFSLPLLSSNFSAELTAIAKAVHHDIPVHNKLIICSDSLAALLALQDLFTMHPLARDALIGIDTLIKNGVKVFLCWIPGHCGIEGNQHADKGAKKAITEGIPLSGVTHEDFIAHIKLKISNKWNMHWYGTRENKLREIKSVTQPWSTSYQANRRDEVVLCRLRIGHTRLTHGYLMNRDSQPTCSSCGVHLSVKHILTECLAYENERKKLSVQGSLDEILSNVPCNANSIIEFLKLTNIYK